MRRSLQVTVFCSLFAAAALTSVAQDGVRADLQDPAIQSKFDGQTRHGVLRGTEEAYITPLYNSSHAANLLELKNGDLLCIWFSGTWEGQSNVAPVFSRLKKGSKRWTKPQLIDRREGESFQNPVIFQEPSGAIDVFHTTQVADAGEAQAHVLETRSADDGNTWSSPRMLFEKDGAFTRHPVLVLQDGTWLMPLTYVTSKGIGQGAETNFSVTKLSRDEGKTWKECLIPQSFGKVQPTIVQVSSTKLIAFFRSRAADSIFRSVSFDGCKWTVPESTALPNNNASIQAFRLRNGHIVIAFDNSKDTVEGGKRISAPRKPLTVALSEDEGETWKYVRDIEVGREGFGQAERKVNKPGREEYSYPTILETRDGVIYVAYTFRRQTIKVVSFSEDWLRHGDSVGVYREPM